MKKLFINFLLVITLLYFLIPTEAMAITIDDVDIKLNGTKVILKENTNKYFFNTSYKAKNAFVEVNVPENIKVKGTGMYQLEEEKENIVISLEENGNEIYNFILEINKMPPTAEELKEIEEDRKTITRNNIFIIIMYIVEFAFLRGLMAVIEKTLKLILRKIKKKV